MVLTDLFKFLDDLLNFQFNSFVSSYVLNSVRASLVSPVGLEYVSGFIFVADYGANRVIKFDLNFNLIKVVSVMSPTWLTSSTNAVYLNSMGTTVSRYDLNLALVKSINCLNICGSLMCCSLQGLFYRQDTNQLNIADLAANGIHVYAFDLSKRISFINLTPYGFNSPRSLSFINGKLIVGGIADNRLLSIDTNTTLSCTTNSVCPKASLIASIFVYASKYILVNCYANKRVNILNLDLTQTGKYLNSSAGNPIGITSDGTRLLVSTYGPARIDLFSSRSTTGT